MNLRLGVTASLLLSACSSGSDIAAPAPTTGGLAISIATTGDQPDADGYTLSIDGGAGTAIGVNGAMTRDGLDAGGHTVAISGLAPNCALTGDNPHAFTVTAGDTLDVALAVSCPTPPPSVGSIKVTTNTTGSDLDADGYTIAVDDGTPLAIGPNTTLTLSDITPGEHTVRFAGAAINCLRQGGNPRTVNVVAGQAEAVSFAVVCKTTPPMVASLVITTLPGEAQQQNLRLLEAGTDAITRVQALDDRGYPIYGVDIRARSVDWTANWPGLSSPPPDPAVQTVRTDINGIATFVLRYPSSMWRIVTWRATAGSGAAEIGLNIYTSSIGPICSEYSGQYTQEEMPECWD